MSSQEGLSVIDELRALRSNPAVAEVLARHGPALPPADAPSDAAPAEEPQAPAWIAALREAREADSAKLLASAAEAEQRAQGALGPGLVDSATASAAATPARSATPPAHHIAAPVAAPVEAELQRRLSAPQSRSLSQASASDPRQWAALAVSAAAEPEALPVKHYAPPYAALAPSDSAANTAAASTTADKIPPPLSPYRGAARSVLIGAAPGTTAAEERNYEAKLREFLAETATPPRPAPPSRSPPRTSSSAAAPPEPQGTTLPGSVAVEVAGLRDAVGMRDRTIARLEAQLASGRTFHDDAVRALKAELDEERRAAQARIAALTAQLQDMARQTTDANADAAKEARRVLDHTEAAFVQRTAELRAETAAALRKQNEQHEARLAEVTQAAEEAVDAARASFVVERDAVLATERQAVMDGLVNDLDSAVAKAEAQLARDVYQRLAGQLDEALAAAVDEALGSLQGTHSGSRIDEWVADAVTSAVSGLPAEVEAAVRDACSGEADGIRAEVEAVLAAKPEEARRIRRASIAAAAGGTSFGAVSFEASAPPTPRSVAADRGVSPGKGKAERSESPTVVGELHGKVAELTDALGKEQKVSARLAEELLKMRRAAKGQP